MTGGPNAAAKAILGSVLISIVLYALVVVGLLLLLPASQFKINADPLLVALQNVSAPSTLIILVGVGALIATASAALAMMLTASRILYQISEDHLLPKVFRAYNKRGDVATNCVIISAAIGILALFSGNVYIIAAISNFGLLFSYIMSSFALLHYRQIKKIGTFKAPLYPYLPVITIVALLAFMFGLPNLSLVIGVIMVLVLLIVYYTIREIMRRRVVRVKLFK